MFTKQEIRQLNGKELEEEVKKTSRELIHSRMDLLNGSTKETHKMKVLKRYYSRLKTIKTENTKKEISVA